MSRHQSTFGWAVLYPNEAGWGSPVAPAIYTVTGTRKNAMELFVAGWRSGAHDGQTVSWVWQRAYRRGWRLSRVVVTPFGATP